MHHCLCKGNLCNASAIVKTIPEITLVFLIMSLYMATLLLQWKRCWSGRTVGFHSSIWKSAGIKRHLIHNFLQMGSVDHVLDIIIRRIPYGNRVVYLHYANRAKIVDCIPDVGPILLPSANINGCPLAFWVWGKRRPFSANGANLPAIYLHNFTTSDYRSKLHPL